LFKFQTHDGRTCRAVGLSVADFNTLCETPSKTQTDNEIRPIVRLSLCVGLFIG